MRLDHPLFTTALEITKRVQPSDFHRMKALGLNRFNRRRLASLTAQGRLSVDDLPLWLVAKIYSKGTALHG